MRIFPIRFVIAVPIQVPTAHPGYPAVAPVKSKAAARAIPFPRHVSSDEEMEVATARAELSWISRRPSGFFGARRAITILVIGAWAYNSTLC